MDTAGIVFLITILILLGIAVVKFVADVLVVARKGRSNRYSDHIHKIFDDSSDKKALIKSSIAVALMLIAFISGTVSASVKQAFDTLIY